MATIPVVKEFQEPGVCTNVTHVTIDTNGLWVRSTAVGQKDEIINDYEMYQHITADVGAVLEATPTGIRISPLAVDSALSGGGSAKLRVDIGKQPQKGITDSDKILFEDKDGNNFWTSRVDIATSGNVNPYTVMGNVTAGAAPAVDLDNNDLPFFTLGSITTALGWETSTGRLGLIPQNSYITQVDFSVNQGSETIDVFHNANGTGFTIPYATTLQAGVLRAVDYQKLESLSSGTVDLSSTFTASSFDILSSTGAGTTIPSANLSTAGAMSANAARLVTKLAGGPGNALMVNYTNVGEAEWAQKDSLTLRTYTTGVRLVGFDSNGNLSAYNPDVSGGGGGGQVENIVHLTGHSLLASDYTKPISSSGTVFDDTSSTDWPLGILKDIIDSNTVELYPPGYEMTLSSSLVDPTFNLGVDGGWVSWDKSAGYYVSTKPSDSIADLTEMVQITEATTGGYYAVVHDHGPLGASVSTPIDGGGGGGSSDPEVVITSSTPSGLTVQTGEKFLVHTSLNDIYRADGSSWTIVEKSVISAPDASTSINVQGAKTVIFSYTSSAVVTAFTNGRDGQQINCIFQNGNAEVDDTGSIVLAHGDIFSPGTNGGSLVLEYYAGNWYEMSRTSYSPKTNIIAGYF